MQKVCVVLSVLMLQWYVLMTTEHVPEGILSKYMIPFNFIRKVSSELRSKISYFSKNCLIRIKKKKKVKTGIFFLLQQK